METIKKTVLMSSDPIAIPLLEWLHTEGKSYFELLEVVSQPDRPSKRGQKIHSNGLAQRAKELGLKLQQPETPNTNLLRAWDRAGTELVLVIAYGHLLGREFFATKRQLLNFHASILPAYRGASPIETAIACGEKKTGVCLTQMTPRMDAGAVCALKTIDIAPEDTGGSLREKLGQLTVKLLEATAKRIVEGKLQYQAQNEKLASYCGKLNRADGQLNFSESAQGLAQRIRALTPSPGCQALLEGQTASFKFREAHALAGTTAEKNGQVLEVGQAGLLIACGEGLLRVKRLQRSGGKWLAADVFHRGLPLQGKCFASAQMTTLLRLR